MLKDTSILTFGTHKGKKLAEVPDSWFIWMHDNGKLFGELKKYAEESIPILKKQAEINERKKAGK